MVSPMNEEPGRLQSPGSQESDTAERLSTRTTWLHLCFGKVTGWGHWEGSRQAAGRFGKRADLGQVQWEVEMSRWV